MAAFFERLLRTLISPRVALPTALILIVLGGTLAGTWGEAEQTPSATDTLPAGYDSTKVTELEKQFGDEDSSVAFVLFTADKGTLDQPTQGQLQQRYAEKLQGIPGQLKTSEDGTAMLGIVPVEAKGIEANTAVVKDLRAASRADLPEGVTAQVTGPAAIQADLAAVFDGANVRLLIATASVVALLLVITYRSPILWIIPLFVVALADRLAAVLATHVLALTDVPWDASTTGILSVLVFGAGTDYALLLISRYRDELRTHDNRFDAMRVALSRTAHSVLASSITVFVALLTLLLSVIPSTRGLGLGCAVGIAVAAFFALVVLPCTLVIFGRWIFWPITPRNGQKSLADSHSLWRRIGEAVGKRPVGAAAAVIVGLFILASGTLGMKTGLSVSEQFLKTPEAISAAERISDSFPAGAADPTTVITKADPAQVAATISAVKGVDSATPTQNAGDLNRIDVVISAKPGSAEAEQTVRDLRAELSSYDATWVGGTEAAGLDETAGTARDRMVIMPLILLLVLIALIVLLRSVVAPVLLVLTTVLSFAAALGLAWWIFTGFLGFESLDSGAPLMSFLFLVALGVDYNIFLVNRAAEEAPGHGYGEGMLRALTSTGGVITSAGILLAAVFAVLGVLPLVVLAQLGLIVCVGVLIDALIVRTLLVPALALWLGDRFWWPRKLTAETTETTEAVTSR